MKWMSFCFLDAYFKKKKSEKINFLLFCFNYVRLPVWMFRVSKVDPLIGNSPEQKSLCWFGEL